jgi:hypothetical protein
MKKLVFKAKVDLTAAWYSGRTFSATILDDLKKPSIIAPSCVMAEAAHEGNKTQSSAGPQRIGDLEQRKT